MAISEEDRAALLKLARQSVAAAAGGGPADDLAGVARVAAEGEGLLSQKRGCFVTLTNAGRRRGCIGTFYPRGPLAEQIVEMAAAAAHDPRFTFDPLTPDEVDDLAVQISVLSELEEIADPLDIELGVHGIYIVSGSGSGCFLPEVATDTGWSKEEFLSQCCSGKAGLSPDAWRDGSAKVYTFTSEKFSDRQVE